MERDEPEEEEEEEKEEIDLENPPNLRDFGLSEVEISRFYHHLDRVGIDPLSKFQRNSWKAAFDRHIEKVEAFKKEYETIPDFTTDAYLDVLYDIIEWTQSLRNVTVQELETCERLKKLRERKIEDTRVHFETIDHDMNEKLLRSLDYWIAVCDWNVEYLRKMLLENKEEKTSVQSMNREKEIESYREKRLI